MNRLLLLIAVFAAMMTSCSTLTPEQKAAKEAQKAIEARQDSIRHDLAVKALEKMDFVLEADRLIFKRGAGICIVGHQLYIIGQRKDHSTGGPI